MERRNYKSTIEGQWKKQLLPGEVKTESQTWDDFYENVTPDDMWGDATAEQQAALNAKYDVIKAKRIDALAEGETFTFSEAFGFSVGDKFTILSIRTA